MPSNDVERSVILLAGKELAADSDDSMRSVGEQCIFAVTALTYTQLR